jgi:SAM-dependent methyltransferase
MYTKNIKIIYEQRLLSQEPKLDGKDIQLRYILNYLPKDKTIKIMDAGCGNGNYASHLSNLEYENVFAVDLFDDIKTDKFNYQQSSIDNLPFDDNNFDFIYSNSVIYYLHKQQNGIKEFERVLKKDGLVFITAHTKYSLFTLWRCIKRFFDPKSVQHLKGVKFYTAKQYAIWLERNGFEIIRIDGYNLSFFIYPFYRKFLRSCDRFLNIKLPAFRSGITQSKSMARLKSIFGYHSIILAKKK